MKQFQNILSVYKTWNPFDHYNLAANKDTLGKIFLILALLALAMTIRLSYLYYTDFINPIRADAYRYLLYAQNLNEYGIFSQDRVNVPPIADSYWGPGYPFFLAIIAVIAKILSTDYIFSVLVTQAILGTLITLLTVLIGQQFLQFRWAYIAGLLVAISPHMISLGAYVLTETLFSFTLMLALFFLALSIKHQNNSYFYASAICFSYSYLVNPVIFFAPLFIVVWVYATKVIRCPNIKVVIIIFLGLYLGVVASWSVRNAVNVPAHASSAKGRLLTNLIIGTHSNYYDIFRADPRDPNNPASVDSREIDGSYITFIKMFTERALERPGHYLYWYLIEKPALLWGWNILMEQGDIYVYPVASSLYHKSKLALASHAISKSLHPWLLIFAALSIPILYFASQKSDKNNFILPLYICLAYISAVYIITQADARYSVPIRPEMYLSAMLTLSIISGWVNSKIKSTRKNNPL